MKIHLKKIGKNNNHPFNNEYDLNIKSNLTTFKHLLLPRTVESYLLEEFGPEMVCISLLALDLQLACCST